MSQEDGWLSLEDGWLSFGGEVARKGGRLVAKWGKWVVKFRRFNFILKYLKIWSLGDRCLSLGDGWLSW